MKCYLKIEIRYSIPRDESLNENACQQTHFTKILNSHLFDNVKDCIDFGNEIILNNLWMEQYPGYRDQRLKINYGSPLTYFSLKNRAEIFISVKYLNVLCLKSINLELQKFNVSEIKMEIPSII